MSDRIGTWPKSETAEAVQDADTKIVVDAPAALMNRANSPTRHESIGTHDTVLSRDDDSVSEGEIDALERAATPATGNRRSRGQISSTGSLHDDDERPAKKASIEHDFIGECIAQVLFAGRTGAEAGLLDQTNADFLLGRQILESTIRDNLTYYTLSPDYYKDALTSSNSIERILNKLDEFNRFDKDTWDQAVVLQLARDLSVYIKAGEKEKIGMLPKLNAKVGDVVYYGKNDVEAARKFFSDSPESPHCAAMAVFTSSMNKDSLQQLLTKIGVDGQIITLMALIKRPENKMIAAVALYVFGCLILSPTCQAMTDFKTFIERTDREAFDFIEANNVSFLNPCFLGQNGLTFHLTQDLLDRVSYSPKRLNLQLMMGKNDAPAVLLTLYGLAMVEHRGGAFGQALGYLELALVAVRQQSHRRQDSVGEEQGTMRLTAEQYGLHNVANYLTNT